MKKQRLITYNGKTQNISKWAVECGLSTGCIVERLKMGWSVEKTLTTPRRKHYAIKRYAYQGQLYTAEQLAQIHGNISRKAIMDRLAKGMTPEEAVNMPKQQGRVRKKPAPVQEPKKPIIRQRKPDYTQCKTCQYRTALSSGQYPANIACGYALVNDHCRSLISPPSPHCTEYIKGPSLVRAAALKKARKGRWG